MQKGNETKPHIGIFGRRNTGKSSLINLLSGQELSIVSPIAGTTTDPVKKSMEIGGIGPVVLIDTAGIDDVGELGNKRVQKTAEVLAKIDCAILLISENCFGDFEERLIKSIKQKEIPFLIIFNKTDIQLPDAELEKAIFENYSVKLMPFSTLSGQSIEPIIDALMNLIPESAYISRSLLSDLISYGDLVLLVTPIDIEAPEGRLILPQVQVIRDVLDNDGIAVVVKERELDALLKKLNPKPALVITDSQAFLKVDGSVSPEIPLTSFSILLARHKGDFESYLNGTPHIAHLKDGDRVLILESCTHHVSCDDIGRMKIPRWITNFTGKKLDFEVISGLSPLPSDLSQFSLVVQCGGCVLTRRQVLNRIKPFVEAGVPVTNYGMAISYVHGIYNRAIAPFTTKSPDNDYL